MSNNYDLYNAFKNRNLGKFTEALEVYEADPNFFIESKGRTVFEIILSTPGSSSFIKKCIEYGADFYVKNSNQQYPLHCVIESKCIENLKEVESLFSYHDANVNSLDSTHKIKYSPYVNVKDSNGQNCLHTLTECLTNDTYEVIFPLMKILLAHGCNANYPDRELQTPFLMVLRKLPQLKNRKDVADYFIKNGDLDFYTHRSDEIIELVMNQKVKYLNVLPDKEDFIVNYENMMQLLMDDEINKFETKFFFFKDSCANLKEYKEHCSAFLEVAVARSLINIVDLLIIDYDIDINHVHVLSKYKIPPPFIAYKNANVGILRCFLLHPDIRLFYVLEGTETVKKKTFLHSYFDDLKSRSYSTYKKSNFNKEMTCDEKKCLHLVLQHKRCDRELINEHDELGLPAIYYTVRYKIDYFTIELLKNGAYIGTVIKNIRKSLLTEFFDSCITTNDKFDDDEDLEIRLNYGFLTPSQLLIDQRKFRKLGNQDTYLPISQKSPEDFESFLKASEGKYAEEMKPLIKIAQKPELQRLLMHPVLSSFILLKWNKVNFLIYINLVFILLYMFSIIPFILISQATPESELSGNAMYNLFKVLSFISLSLLIFRESMQFFLSIRQYVLSRSNWIDMALIVSSLTILLFQWQIPNHISRMLRTVIILLTVAEYFKLLGFLPLLSISLHTKMFKKVCTTFVKSLSFYSVLIVGFAFSFYTLHGDKYMKDLDKHYTYGRDNTSNAMPPLNETRSDRYNNFYTVGLAVIKSFAMLSGELEGSYMHQEGLTYGALFLLFTFLVTIVLYNLLNALAVSDTQEIKSDARLIDLHQRILTMQEAEEAVFKRNSYMGNYLKRVISMFPNTVPDGWVSLKPNRSLHIFVKETEPITLYEWVPKQLSFLKNKNVKINEEIVQDIRKFLEKEREEKTITAIRKLKENRNEKLANDIIKINEMISDVQTNIIKLQSDVYSLKKRANL